MRGETEALVRDVESSLDLLRKRMGWETARHRLEEFDARVGDPTLWDDPPAARRLMQDRQALLDAIEAHDSIKGDLGALVDLIGMAGDEEDAEVLSEAETELASLSRVAATRVSDALLDGEADANDAFLEINAGPGGTESCDWAMMLTRMYLRWAERRGYDWELQAESEGDEAGVRSATYRINGRNAHGWLKSEAGLHRLVRISPFGFGAGRFGKYTHNGLERGAA